MQSKTPHEVVFGNSPSSSQLDWQKADIVSVDSPENWYFRNTLNRFREQRMEEKYYGTSEASDYNSWKNIFSIRSEHPAIDSFTISNQLAAHLPRPSSVRQQTTQEIESSELVQLKEELNAVKTEASYEGIELPTTLAFKNAEIMIEKVYQIAPDDLLIELLPDSGIAVTRTGPFGCSLMIVCDSDGEILVSLNLDGEYQRTTFSGINMFDECFVRSALGLLTEREKIDAPDDVQPNRRG